MAPHSSTPAWKIPWMEEPGRLQSMGSLRVGHNWATSLSLFTFVHWRRKWQPTPGSSVPGILQARTLEWVAISFSNAWKWKVKVKLLSCAQLLATPWTAAYQAHPSMRFSRQEYWSGMPLSSPPWTLAITNLLSLSHNFVISRILYSWNSIVCGLLRLMLFHSA